MSPTHDNVFSLWLLFAEVSGKYQEQSGRREFPMYFLMRANNRPDFPLPKLSV